MNALSSGRRCIGDSMADFSQVIGALLFPTEDIHGLSAMRVGDSARQGAAPAEHCTQAAN
ncbi:hypothetical protein ACSFA8_19450 [Variovorax sp. RT4R15]|uniref:hypothetical protein n=1 Tax=Variovorax sp. RT4R15 TaxID=3443737 RepID=UPI003F463653